MRITLSDHFTYQKLLRFTMPSIVMMIVTSVYSIVDGFFVSNCVGKNAFAALNLIFPVLMALSAFGFMVGTGGSALIGKTMGEGDRKHADRLFSMVICVTALSGLALGVLGIVLLRPVAELLGAEGELLENCVRYGRLILIANPAYVLQFAFQCLFATAGKPKLGLAVTVAAGVTNMVLDALFVGVFRWGIAGAAIATGISQTVGGVVPLMYFLFSKSSPLRLRWTKFEVQPLLRSCANGSSELMSNISGSLIGMLYNAQLMRFLGEDGVATYGVLMYVQLIFIGTAIGCAPIVSYHYGAGHHDELKNMLKKSLTLMGITGVALTMLALGLAAPLAKIFVGYDEGLLSLTRHAFSIFSFSFLLSGLNIFASGFFTALNNGLISAVISFARTLVFQAACVLLLPAMFGVDGIWYATLVAEGLACLLSLWLIDRKKHFYHYL